MGARHEGRVAAMQVLYQLDTTGDFEDVEGVVARFFSNFEEEQGQTVRDFASELCAGVVEYLEPIDDALDAASTRWRLSRMSRVDRSVLRLAAYEVLYCPEVPNRVVINEALEVGKRFGSEDSRAFINGVLEGLRARAEGDPKSS